MRTNISPFSFLIAFAMFVTSSDSAWAIEENSIITVNRVDIEIDRSSEAVWPYVLDFSKWAKEQVVEPMNELENDVGALITRKIYRNGKLNQQRSEEIIAIEAQRRLTYKVHPIPNPTNMTVIANIELIPLDRSKTILRLDVYMNTELGGNKPLSLEDKLAQKRNIEAGMMEPLLDAFMPLKNVVESK